MENTYQAFLKKNIDLAPLGVEKRGENTPYFCTPRGASVIGWAGVDGIHFCFIRGFGEMVFSVSPMNTAPDFVHPLAKNFADFLRLLLACGDSAALEQAWQWDEARFSAFLEENRPTEEQQLVLDRIADQMGLSPMENPWQSITRLQAEFDSSKVLFTEEYYELIPQQPAAWEVYFDGNFWGHESRQRAGKEIPLNTHFDWAGHHWVIPAVYACSKGLVVDFCMQVEPNEIYAFMKKWDLNIENELEKEFTQEQQMQLDLDNPLTIDFQSVLQLNGRELNAVHGCGTTYNPCLPEEYAWESEAKTAVDHYRLDPAFGWVIFRSSYPWATKRKPEIKSLSVTMVQEKAAVPGSHFRIHAPGDIFSFYHQETDYTLTVQEYEPQTLDVSGMERTGMEYPIHFHALTYTTVPELPDGVMTLVDCVDGDSPRGGATVGIIGGADRPVMLTYGERKTHGACSSLHFAPAEDVEWRMVFHEKQFEDMTVDVLTKKEDLYGTEKGKAL